MTPMYKKVLGSTLALLMTMGMLSGCGSKPADQTIPATEQTQTNSTTEPENPIQATEPDVTGEPEVSIPQNTDPNPDEELITQPPTEPPVQVTMPDYELSYAGWMKDSIRWEELPEEGSLRFFVTLSNGEEELFTMRLNQDEGDFVIMKENTAGEKIPVAFLMTDIPEGLSAEEEQTFCLAQELVNDVVASLVLK